MPAYYHGSKREDPRYNEDNWKAYLAKEIRFLNYTRANPDNQSYSRDYKVPVVGRPWDGTRKPEEFCPRSTLAANQFWETMKSFNLDKSNCPAIRKRGASAYMEKVTSFNMGTSRRLSLGKRGSSASCSPQRRPSTGRSSTPAGLKLYKTVDDIKFDGGDHKRTRSSWYAGMISFPGVPESEQVQKIWRNVPKLTTRSVNTIRTPCETGIKKVSKEVKGYLKQFGAESFGQLCARPCTKNCDRKQGEQVAIMTGYGEQC